MIVYSIKQKTNKLGQLLNSVSLKPLGILFKQGVQTFGPDENKLQQQHGLASALLVKPVISHAGSVPLQATVPAPLKSALRARTFHVHAATCKTATEWLRYLANT